MKKNFLIFIILLANLSSCSENNKSESFFRNVKAVTLYGNLVKGDSTVLWGDCNHLSLFHHKLFIYNPKGDFGFVVYDLNSKDYTYFGKVGNGPQEGLLYSPHLSTVKIKDKDYIVCCDIAKRNLLYFHADSLNKFEKSLNIEGNRQNSKLILEAFPLNDSTVLAAGAFNHGVCSFFVNGRNQNEFLEPYTMKGNFINRALKDGAIFKLSDDGKFLLRIVQNGGLISLYEVDNETCGLYPLFEKEYFPVECKDVNGELEFTSDAKYGYINACLSKKYIYGLYVGKELKNENYKSNQIHVYTYDGILCRVINVDKMLSAIVADVDDTILYGIESEGDKNLYEYNLSSNQN